MKKDQTRVTFQCDKKLNDEMRDVAYISRITKTDIILKGIEMYISYLKETNRELESELKKIQKERENIQKDI